VHRRRGRLRRQRPLGQPLDSQHGPDIDPLNRLLATRTIYYEKPGHATGAARSAQVASDFGVTATAWP
jgi:hypothetical protein